MKTCIITGATGYIGSHVTRYLLSRGWIIHIVAQPEFGYANIEDIKEQIQVIEYDGNIGYLIKKFSEINPDAVFHLAAAVIANYKPEQIPILIQSNIQFGTEILEAMKACNSKLFIGTGSYWQNYNSDSYNPVDLYAATKEAFEKIVQYYVDAHKFRAITLRLFDVYGEDDKRPKLLNLLKKISETGESIDVSPGNQYLDMVHISDVCTAYLKAYELLQKSPDIKNEIYGVYTGHRIQLKDMINLFQQIIGKKINVNFGKKPYKEREVMSPCKNYKKVPDWKAKVTLEMGLKRFIENKS